MMNHFAQATLAAFLKQFLPLHAEAKQYQCAVKLDIKGSDPVAQCSSFIQQTKQENVCPGHEFFTTRCTGTPHDEHSRWIDVGLYPSGDSPREGEHDWDRQRLSITWVDECANDPFDKDESTYMNPSVPSEVLREHLSSCANRVFMHQQRCFHFSILISPFDARIIRWDRTGGVVTEKIKYRTHPEQLCRFLWRFCHLSDEEQGLDLTAMRVKAGTEDYTLMDLAAQSKTGFSGGQSWDMLETPRLWTDEERLDYARSLFADSIEGDFPRWKLLVYDEGQKKRHEFLVGRPFTNSTNMFGRTRGYMALNCETRQIVFLKDAWRVDVHYTGGRREGDVMELLREKSVRNVPTVYCHGDIQGQKAVAQKDLPPAGRSRRWPAPEPMFMELFHYRLVEEEVGLPLRLFENSHVLEPIQQNTP